MIFLDSKRQINYSTNKSKKGKKYDKIFIKKTLNRITISCL